MSSQGPNSAATIDLDASIGTVNWGSYPSAISSNNVYTVAVVNNETTVYLRAVGFGFSIPMVSVIDGIKVEVECFDNVASGHPTLAAKLRKNTAYVGDEKTIAFPRYEAYVALGDVTQLWGTTWVPTEINSDTFGVGIYGTWATGSDRTLSIDHIRITVYYHVITQIMVF
jgi:hypothetical protein